MVHTNWVIYGLYTVVILSVTAVYVIVNGSMRSFTIVVMIGLGGDRFKKFERLLRLKE